MAHYEIRTTVKGAHKVVESLTSSGTREQAISRIKELKKADEKGHYELVAIDVVYDTANPPPDVNFF